MRDQISTTLSDVSKSVTENYSETNERVLDAVVDNSRKAVDIYVRTADQVADQLPEFNLPFEVPTATETGDRYMEFVERLVDMNRDFSERIVKLNREYTDRVVKMLAEDTAPAASKPAPKPAAKTAPKPAAKTTRKPVAKKTTKKAAASK